MEAVMRHTTSAVALLVALLARPVLAAAQESVASFDLLNTRLKPGDTVYITDAQGREIKGRISSLTQDALTLEDDGARLFAAPNVSAIHLRQKNHAVRNGAFVGLAVGIGLAAAYGHTYCSNHDCEAEDPNLLGLAEILIAGGGAAIGATVGHFLPGHKRIVYRSPGAHSTHRDQPVHAIMITGSTAS